MKSIKIFYLIGLVIVFFTSCKKTDKAVFTLLDPKSTQITFNNTITENDSINILENEYIYNGGGVALADFNGDGLDDVFFTGNMVSNRLYLNKGTMKFEDVTEKSGISGGGRWCSGVAVADINLDGKPDIYVTTTFHNSRNLRANLLYINKSTADKISFEEMATPYGIADTSYSTNAVFFDYDNDLDLDLFIINNKTKTKNDIATYKLAKNDPRSPKRDKLYRNDFNQSKGHPEFTDVSEAAGIVIEGFSLGLNICDINKDGWKDIYITNDFLSNDVLYINNQNGTFTNKINDYLNHTCYSAMGMDITDINNDGLEDIIALDMLPESNYRKKTMMGANNYTSYINNSSYDYTHQFVRNVLQLNRGNTSASRHPVFSDIAMHAGLESTDWSWSPLVADFDADGWRDIIITNGFPKDITDKDFMDYQAENMAYVSKSEMLKKIPEVKLKNYAYKNNQNLSFSNVTDKWGILTTSFSNGAAYGDLDNDGDLDYIVNNINDIAHVYQNNTADHRTNHYLKIQLKGDNPNPDALGTTILYNTAKIASIYEHTLSRGYLSSHSPTVFIGLGSDTLVNLKIIWPNNKISELKAVHSDQTITIHQSEAKPQQAANQSTAELSPLLIKNTEIPNDSFSEVDYIDFNFDPLLLKKYSNLGPGIAVSDINKDGSDDFYITGSSMRKGKLYLSKKGKYTSTMELPVDSEKEELAPLFFDADNDGDDDLYIGCGSNEFSKNNPRLKDAFLINDNGVFRDASGLIPLPGINTSCVKANDVDQDGDMDLFIGGRFVTNEFPKPELSYLLINESKNGEIVFKTDSTSFSGMTGMVSDALFTDFDGDGWQDLIMVGEWFDITFFKNTNSKFTKWAEHGLGASSGFWNSINGADLDNDGDIDYVLGNYGTNSLVKASSDFAARIYSKDFDNNGSYDFIPTVYYKDNLGKPTETPYHVKADLTKELNGFRKRFLFYHQLALAPMDSILTKSMRTDAMVSEANCMYSSTLINLGNGKFKLEALPALAQISPIMGTLIEDIDGDGHLDILTVGNNYGSELGIGRMDAGYGLVLKGDSKNNFVPLDLSSSGIFLKSDTRAIARIVQNGKSSFIITNQNGPLNAYNTSKAAHIIYPDKGDTKVVFSDSKGHVLMTSEIYIGSSYLSQSGRSLVVPEGAVQAKLYSARNKERIVSIGK
ncbi:MAG: VCBS repeat-containing protein [Saprospiraceae bacterium]|nr:VCBS repeat-containing protein [Saprospiraceae bacterium]